jgi:hypothetical protein
LKEINSLYKNKFRVQKKTVHAVCNIMVRYQQRRRRNFLALEKSNNEFMTFLIPNELRVSAYMQVFTIQIAST